MPSMSKVAALAVLTLIVGGLIIRSRRPRVPVWAIMAAASALTVVTGLEPIDEIGEAVDLDVVLFLVGMFSLVGLAEESGLLDFIAAKLVCRAGSTRRLLLASSIVLGLLAAFAVNDTIALMGAPMVYSMAKAAGADPVPFILVLAFAVTIGSTTTPIGNPQNLLIAIESGMPAPFVKFLAVLSIPTLVNLAVTPLIVARLYKLEDRKLEGVAANSSGYLRSRRDAAIAAVFLTATVALLVANDLLEMAGIKWVEHRGFIPFVTASLAYIFSSNARKALSRVDWGTIVFFIAMFVAMNGVWRSGIMQPLLALIMPGKQASKTLEYLRLTVASLLVSQLLSNVPFVKLFIDYMKFLGYTGEDERAWLTLAMSSTIAGNLTLLGAASNIIILEALESRHESTITFTEFLKTGAIVTAVNIAVYTPFLLLL